MSILNNDANQTQGILIYELAEESEEAAAMIMYIGLKNAHLDAPFAEERSGLTPKQFFGLMETAGLNRNVWIRDSHEPEKPLEPVAKQVAPILFRKSEKDLDTIEPEEEFTYYLLTPINTEDRDDEPQFNQPMCGILLDEEETMELILEVFGKDGLRVEFGAGPQLISDDVEAELISLLPKNLPSKPDFPFGSPKPDGST